MNLNLYKLYMISFFQDVIGKDCKVQDPRYNSTFDLNVLRSTVEDISLPLNSRMGPAVRFNLCGPLLKSCNGISNTSLCIYRNGSEYAIGKVLVITEFFAHFFLNSIDFFDIGNLFICARWNGNFPYVS